MSDSGSSDGEVDFKPSIDVSNLPVPVQNRVKALKNLQLKTVQAESEYYKAVGQLDLEFQKKYDEIHKQRANILTGSYEPSGAEIEWKDAEEDDEEDDKKLANGVAKLSIDGMDENTKGIPKFWMYTLKNGNEEALMGLIEPHDEPVLEYLQDLTVKLNEPGNSGFTLSFMFSENPYFTNSVLSKHYMLREGPDPESPLEYDGPEIISCSGSSIDWKTGKDVTQATVKVKKIKARKSGKGSPDKDLIKVVKTDSFFNFFSPPEIPEGKEDEMDDDDRATLAVDFDVGFALKEKIIPRAVLYFTGEAFVDDDDEFEDCDSEDADTEEDDDGDN
jgi:nucleosome assembly protein 1-like 1